jgi:hypothetical protein
MSGRGRGGVVVENSGLERFAGELVALSEGVEVRVRCTDVDGAKARAELGGVEALGRKEAAEGGAWLAVAFLKLARQ